MTVRAARHTPLAYLARYVYMGQHRRGRIDLDDRLGIELAKRRAQAAARRRHPAGTRLNLAGMSHR